MIQRGNIDYTIRYGGRGVKRVSRWRGTPKRRAWRSRAPGTVKCIERTIRRADKHDASRDRWRRFDDAADRG